MVESKATVEKYSNKWLMEPLLYATREYLYVSTDRSKLTVSLKSSVHKCMWETQIFILLSLAQIRWCLAQLWWLLATHCRLKGIFLKELSEHEKQSRQTRKKKAAGPDGIPSEHMKCGGGVLFVYLSIVFQAMLRHTLVPAELKESVVVPNLRREVETCWSGQLQLQRYFVVFGYVYAVWQITVDSVWSPSGDKQHTIRLQTKRGLCRRKFTCSKGDHWPTVIWWDR